MGKLPSPGGRGRAGGWGENARPRQNAHYHEPSSNPARGTPCPSSRLRQASSANREAVAAFIPRFAPPGTRAQPRLRAVARRGAAKLSAARRARSGRRSSASSDRPAALAGHVLAGKVPAQTGPATAGTPPRGARWVRAAVRSARGKWPDPPGAILGDCSSNSIAAWR